MPLRLGTAGLHPQVLVQGGVAPILRSGLERQLVEAEKPFRACCWLNLVFGSDFYYGSLDKR